MGWTRCGHCESGSQESSIQYGFSIRERPEEKCSGCGKIGHVYETVDE